MGLARMKFLFKRRRRKTKIEICTSNLMLFFDDEALDLLERLLDEENTTVREMDCLSYCEDCRRTPYVLLNSSRIHGGTPEQLIQKLKEQAFAKSL